MSMEQYKEDLEALLAKGLQLRLAIRYETVPERMGDQGLSEEEIKALPHVADEYQSWYSEALALIKQLIPDRADDFQSYYTPSKTRKTASYETYTMFDYLKGLQSKYDNSLRTSAGITVFDQQYQILRSAQSRFKSSLFDIRALVQADLLDNELDAAEALNKAGFPRGAGAVCGVSIEAHLAEICARHGIAIRKQSPTISDLNDALKSASVVDVATWRFIQHLADIRNKCDHKKSADPTTSEVSDLIEGARKITKTVY